MIFGQIHGGKTQSVNNCKGNILAQEFPYTQITGQWERTLNRSQYIFIVFLYTSPLLPQRDEAGC